jgi:DNA-binding NarL/FixJ family response regulator
MIRVVLGEDSFIVREGLREILATQPEVEVVAACGDLDELLEAVRRHRPDVVMTDIRMPPTNTDEGIVAAQRIRDLHPRVGVLVLSQYVEPGFAMRLLEENPERSGYLLKERISDPAILVDALRRLAEGETVVDPTIVSRLLARRREADPVDELSDREREVLALVAEGLSNGEIGRRLFITERTVEAHVKQIFQKLAIGQAPETNRRVLAVLAFLRSSATG